MKHYQITIEGRRFDVRLLGDPQQEEVQVEVNGRTLTVGVKALPVAGEATAAAPSLEIAPAPISQATALSASIVAAPLPGVIKSVVARPGQRVSVGDELLVIEAMKMDNVIRASREGIIDTIHVAEGHQVAHGEPLLEYRE